MISLNTFKNLHRKLFFFLVLLLPTQLGFHFWPDWASIFGIRVDYLSPTIYLTDLLVVGILASWLPGELRNRRTEELKNQKGFVLFLGFLVSTTIFVAGNHWAALYKLAKLIEFFLLGFYVFKNFPKYSTRSAREPVLHTLYFPLSVAMLYSCAIAWTQFLTGHTLGLWLLGERSFDVNTPGIALVNIGGQDFLRAYATFPHPNVLAGFLLTGLLLLMSTSKFNKSSSNFQFLIFNFNSNFKFQILNLVAIATIIITFSHSVWIAGLATLFFLKIKWFTNHAKIFTQIAIIGAVVVSLLFSVISRNVDTTTLPEEVGRRAELARVVGTMISDFPLTGVGLGNFIIRLPEYGGTPAVSWWLQPVHNIFLLVLSETGLIGIGLFTWFLLKIAKLEIRNWKLEIAFLVILITGMSDHYWLTLQQGQLVAGIVFGASIATIKK